MIISSIGRTILNGDNVTATSNYIYTSTGLNGAEDGWLNARYDHNAVAICVATLNASAINYRIEDRFNTYTRPLNLGASMITSAQSIDKIINISEHVNEIRVGIYADNDASPNNVYLGLGQTEIK